MARITQEEARKLWIKLKPTRNVIENITKNAIEEVNKKVWNNWKYWAKKTTYKNVLFHSQREAKRYKELELLEKAWEIFDLKLQPKFVLQEKFEYDWKTERKITYSADFLYKKGKDTIVEDVKSSDWNATRTNVYKIKRKLFLFKYGHLYKFIET